MILLALKSLVQNTSYDKSCVAPSAILFESQVVDAQIIHMWTKEVSSH